MKQNMSLICKDFQLRAAQNEIKNEQQPNASTPCLPSEGGVRKKTYKK
jgi:hypothetical protein